MLDTRSSFYYGYNITAQPQNGFLNIDEGPPVKQIEQWDFTGLTGADFDVSGAGKYILTALPSGFGQGYIWFSVTGGANTQTNPSPPGATFLGTVSINSPSDNASQIVQEIISGTPVSIDWGVISGATGGFYPFGGPTEPTPGVLEFAYALAIAADDGAAGTSGATYTKVQNGTVGTGGANIVTVELPVGSYTLTTIVEQLRESLLTQGTLEYSVLVDRATRKITISATTNFDLLTNTGANVGSSAWSLLGFDTTSDKVDSGSYTSDFASGFEYRPQFYLQSYVGPDDYQGKQQASKNIAANGKTVEVVNFGVAKFIEMDIKFITSRLDISDGINILHNPTGLEDARAFLQDITQLSEFEFLPDAESPGTYFRCIVESMPSFSDGTGYKLKELFNQNLRDVFETGVIKMRVIE